jgi:hypothetical protein
MAANPVARIERFIKRYVALPNEEMALVLALWVLHTWMFHDPAWESEMRRMVELDETGIADNSRNLRSPHMPHTTPYLYVYSPEKQSGKTRLIEVLAELVHNPMRASDMSNAVLFRSIGLRRPTVLLDEADTIWSGQTNEELRATVNSGYKYGGATWRIAGEEPVEFSTFCPKLMAGIDNGLMPDTIRDRSIPIALKRKKRGQEVQPFYSFDVEAEATEIADIIAEWIKDRRMEIAQARPKPIKEISDRAWEISFPLVSIAEAISANMGSNARKAIVGLLAQNEPGLSPQQQLLSDIRDMFNEREVERLFTRDILERLGGRWNGKLLGNRLRPFGIKIKTIRIGNETQQGVYREEFEDAWSRYLD